MKGKATEADGMEQNTVPQTKLKLMNVSCSFQLLT